MVSPFPPLRLAWVREAAQSIAGQEPARPKIWASLMQVFGAASAHAGWGCPQDQKSLGAWGRRYHRVQLYKKKKATLETKT